jgi:hypothetical protein
LPSSIIIITATAVARHRPLRLDVDQAVCLEVRDLAAPRDQRHGAGQRAGIDVALDRRADAPEPLAREADVLGLTGRRDGACPSPQRQRQRRHTREDHEKSRRVMLHIVSVLGPAEAGLYVTLVRLKPDSTSHWSG